MKSKMTQGRFSRRDFVKAAAAASAGVALAGVRLPSVHAAGSDIIKVGLIGCGGRGTGAARDCMDADPAVRIWALGDLFQRRADYCRRILSDYNHSNVAADRCFSGFDNYQKVLDSGVDMVILATPPGFRPGHIKAAIEAGKHVFAEMPVAVDPVGVRSVIASAELAKQKNLALAAGTQRRHQESYIENIKRIHDGAIGRIVSANCYWMSGTIWLHDTTPQMSEMEVQCRNWYYYTWLSGDHIVEQHIHNIDVINWAIGAMPSKCMGVGGRQVRTQPQFGHIFDHFTVEYQYPGGVRVLSMCSQNENAASRISEFVMGTNGTSDCAGVIHGPNRWQFEGESADPMVQEHKNLIASIRAGRPLNEGRRIAESTLCAIMGRMSAYTGREISFDWALKASKLDTFPKKLEFGPHPVDPVATPGVTRLV